MSGDNAVVIALAARALPAHQQKRAVCWGSGAAVFMRIVLTLFAVALLQLPYLKMIGACLLLVIGVQLLQPQVEDDAIDGHDNLWAAIKTILIADLVMSMDNVIAVAAASGNNTLLLILGLAMSIPMVIFGSTMLMKVMTRFPIIVVAGGALLGFVAGEMGVGDPALSTWIAGHFEMDGGGALLGGFPLDVLVDLLGAACVVIVGKVKAKRCIARSAGGSGLAS